MEFLVMYCNDSGDVCCCKCSDKDELNETLIDIEQMHGEVKFGSDLMHCEVMVIRGEVYIPELKTEKRWV